ncbi:MAG: hypothetical protein KF901_00445 [Myxococcales bacterium]|nr:hypothetical protein [Myxococcales bacterium]
MTTRLSIFALCLAGCSTLPANPCGELTRRNDRCVCPDGAIPLDDWSCELEDGRVITAPGAPDGYSPLGDGGIELDSDTSCTARPEVCNGLDDDCDGRIDEHPTECAFENAVTACVGGTCTFSMCTDGHLDCDATIGCEVDGRSDRANCGACGNVCGLTETCNAGRCSGPTISVLAQAVGYRVTGSHPRPVFLTSSGSGGWGISGTASEAVVLNEVTSPPSDGSDDAVSFSVRSSGVAGFHRRFGGPGVQNVEGVGTDALGSLYSIGTYTSAPVGTDWQGAGAYLSALSPTGDLRWSRQLLFDRYTNARFGFSALRDGTSFVLLHENFGNRVTIRNGTFTHAVNERECTTLIQFDSAGNPLFLRNYDWCDGARGISASGTDRSYLVYGHFENLHTRVRLPGYEFVPAPDTVWYVGAAKFALDGALSWARFWACPGSDTGSINSAVIDDSGDVVFVGGCPGESTINFGGDDIHEVGFMVRMDSDGNHVWSRPLPSDPRRIIMGHDGHLYVSGEGRGPLDFGLGFAGGSGRITNHWVASYSLADGDVRFGHVFAGSGNLTSGDTVEVDAGRLLTSFVYRDPISVGGVTYTPPRPTVMVVGLDLP